MFDAMKAQRAVKFINNLKHTKGVWHGVPFDLLPWQDKIITDIFGTVKEDGFRQYNTAYVEIPKKNGKSEIAAAIALYLTCGDNEWGAEVYGCAADRQQASIVFDVAVDMVDQCPALKKRIKPIISQKRLVYMPLGSFYQVLSAEAYTKHGLNVHGVIFDELHAQPGRELYDVMTKGSGDARKQPLFFLITTAGNDRNSICYEVHQKASDIITGRKIDPTFYPVIYGIKDEDDWQNEANWYKANPSLGHTIDIEKVRAAMLSAKENPAEENIFRQLRLNQWVKQSIRWMPMEVWDKCSFAVDIDKLKGRECYGGLDLSSSNDITAFVLIFPPTADDDKYYVIPYFWIPEDNLKLRVKRDHVPYDVWEKQGFVKTTEGNVIHYGFIESFIEELGTMFNIKEIAFDRWGAVQMVQNLEGLGFTVVPFGQGYKDMSPPTKELMKLALEKRIAHGGHPVLKWMMDNIHVRTDPAGNIKPDKEKSTEKIDGAVALIMALDRSIRHETKDSVYDNRGILIL
ncbi:terminase large subunit [Clostridium butyricum]|uniref:terminase large subunit n=1 Tax=Clostridium butyricum TaxID=1492 RepID=UPI00129B4E77|nr:terminase TerL endonuclease subunit [Clostridium butyricum]QGH20223.1 terminase large subunit [Clostridium butyricum]QGH24258.1 terminase large subunit [Clostridium butyricum]